MNFTHALLSKLSDKHLLKHEFYQAWNCGEVPMETLRLYAQQYYHHVKAFPRYVSATHSNCDEIKARQFLLENLIDEEKGEENHPELWMKFAEGMGETRENVKNASLLPETTDLVDTFMGFAKKSYPEGLGALFAYENQIPEVAKFKIDALRKHYQIENASTLAFFQVHQSADVYHTQTLTGLLNELSPEDQKLAENAATVTADRLWKFLDGIHKTMA